MARLLFYGLPAYVGNVVGKTVADVWLQDPAAVGYDPTCRVRLDLARSPVLIGAGHHWWDEVQVDDADGNGGRTTLGPDPLVRAVGGVYLETRTLDRMRRAHRHLPDWQTEVPDGYRARPHEFQTLAIVDPATGAVRRYYGFHAKIVDPKATPPIVAIWHAGSSLASEPALQRAVDLTDQAVCDQALTKLSAESPEGPLFLEASYAASVPLYGPKLPLVLGLCDPVGTAPAVGVPDGHVALVAPGAGDAVSLVNVSTRTLDDPELLAVQETVARVETVADRAGLEGLLGALRDRGAAAGRRSLDLIAHSRGGLLRLGSWLIQADGEIAAFAAACAQRHLLDGVGAVRLLGCCTAVGGAAQETLDALAAALHVEVLGTIGPIWAEHFDENGFRDAYRSLLAPGGSAAPPPAPVGVALDGALDWSRLDHAEVDAGVTELDAAGLAELKGHVDATQPRSAPGLLAEPTHRLHARHNAKRHRFDVLLDGTYVRVYSRTLPDGHALLPVKSPAKLKTFVAGRR